jgi:hypothetical protein
MGRGLRRVGRRRRGVRSAREGGAVRAVRLSWCGGRVARGAGDAGRGAGWRARSWEGVCGTLRGEHEAVSELRMDAQGDGYGLQHVRGEPGGWGAGCGGLCAAWCGWGGSGGLSAASSELALCRWVALWRTACRPVAVRRAPARGLALGRGAGTRAFVWRGPARGAVWRAASGAFAVWRASGGAFAVWRASGGAFTVWRACARAFAVWCAGRAFAVWRASGGAFAVWRASASTFAVRCAAGAGGSAGVPSGDARGGAFDAGCLYWR